MRPISSIVLMTVAWLSIGCGDSGRDAARAIVNTASAEVQSERAQMIEELKARHVILKASVGDLESELYVLPSFQILDVDQKHTVIQICYAWVYGLPEGTAEFPGLMYILDGQSGDHLHTVDQQLRGLRID